MQRFDISDICRPLQQGQPPAVIIAGKTALQITSWQQHIFHIERRLRSKETEETMDEAQRPASRKGVRTEMYVFMVLLLRRGRRRPL
jgi:hypothetical protein